jgi:hypothetical protein
MKPWRWRAGAATEASTASTAWTVEEALVGLLTIAVNWLSR